MGDRIEALYYSAGFKDICIYSAATIDLVKFSEVFFTPLHCMLSNKGTCHFCCIRCFSKYGYVYFYYEQIMCIESRLGAFTPNPV